MVAYLMLLILTLQFPNLLQMNAGPEYRSSLSWITNNQHWPWKLNISQSLVWTECKPLRVCCRRAECLHILVGWNPRSADSHSCLSLGLHPRSRDRATPLCLASTLSPSSAWWWGRGRSKRWLSQFKSAVGHTHNTLRIYTMYYGWCVQRFRNLHCSLERSMNMLRRKRRQKEGNNSWYCTSALVKKGGWICSNLCFPSPLPSLYLCIPLSPLLHRERAKRCGIP